MEVPEQPVCSRGRNKFALCALRRRHAANDPELRLTSRIDPTHHLQRVPPVLVVVELTHPYNRRSTNRWTPVSLEDIARLSPEVLLVPADGDPGDLGSLIRAVGPKRVHVLSCPAIDIPGPHLTELAPKIRAILSSYTQPP